MEVTDKGLSSIQSSTPKNPSVTQKPSSSDENDHYYQQMSNFNFQNPKKSMTKNYMSPTISAASKAIVSRKNILGERNESSEPIFPNTHVEKSPIVDPKSPLAILDANASLSQALPLSHPALFQCHGDEQNALPDDGLFPMPYDPIKNYLSPRPQFLRYKPNRRRELFLGLDNSIEEANDGLSLSTSRSGSFESRNAIDEEIDDFIKHNVEGSVEEIEGSGSLESRNAIDDFIKQNVEGSDEEIEGSGSLESRNANDEEIEDFIKQKVEGSDEEIEGSGSLESRNANDEEIEDFIKQKVEGSDEEIEGSDEEMVESDEENEGVEEEKGCNLKGVLKSFLLFVVLVLFASRISYMNHETLFEGVKDGYCRIQNDTFEAAILKKLESGSNIWDQTNMGSVEVIKGAIEMGIEEVKVVEPVLVKKHETESEVMGQGEETQMGLMEEQQRVIDDEGVKDEGKVEDENLGAVESSDDLREVSEPQAEDIEDIEEISDSMGENSELEGAETPGKYVTFQHYQKPSMSDVVDHYNLVSDVSNAYGKEEGKIAMEPTDGIFERKMKGLEGFTNMPADQLVMAETMDSEENTGLNEIFDTKAEGNLREKLINLMGSKTFHTAAAGVSIFSLIVAASFVLVFHFKQKKATKKDSSVVTKPCARTLIIEQKKINGNSSSLLLKPNSESVIAEKYNSVLPNRGDDNSIGPIYSSFKRMSLSSATEAASEECYHSQAPTIELLGEFSVAEVSSSLRSCGMKSKMRRGDECNYSISLEKSSKIRRGEESNYSMSSEKKLGSSKVHSDSIQSQLPMSEFSTMDSPSYGSKTSGKTMKKKEGGKDGEITTPLRRSSRIRSRTVTSP